MDQQQLSEQLLDGIKETTAAVRDLTNAIAKGMQASELRDAEVTSQISALTTAIGMQAKQNRYTGGSDKTSPFVLIFGVAAIIFGLMAPQNQATNATNETVQKMQDAMTSDNLRERIDAAEFSAVKAALVEIETQFRNHAERLAVIDKRMILGEERDFEQQAERATTKEQLRVLSKP